MYKNIIKEAYNQNKLAIFVGSGVSKNSNLPDWGELIENLQKELNTKETDFLKVAQLYYLAVGEATYLQNIKNYFDTKVKPNSIHKYIFELKPKYIITTNWDTLLEDYSNKIYNKYKVVSSDKDLVSSNIDKMIIKMHGDFNSEKFVFKEDDYINYSKDYPLIENFVKSILSTHTILFVGYSYSDINIKYIARWIQNSSKLQPPMFYLSFEENKHYEKYLQNYKIETVVIPEYNKENDYGYRLEKFLQELSDYVNEKKIEIANVNLYKAEDIKEVLDFIYEKLQVLENQNYILREQILEVLRECNFKHVDKNSFLYFYEKELTYDYSSKSKNLRKIYQYFVELLREKENILKCFNDKDKKDIKKKIDQIIDIFLHSNVAGVIVKKEPNQFWPYSFSGKCPFELFSFYKKLLQDDFQSLDNYDDSLIGLQFNIFSLYHKREYKKAFFLNKELISQCFENNNYVDLLFAYFNHNQLIYGLRNSVIHDVKFKNDVSETWAYSLEKYNIEEKFYEFPVEVRNQLKTLKKFLTMEFINDLYVKIDDEYQKKKEQEKAIKDDKRGLYLDSNIDRFYAYQKELVLFYLRNMILLDKHFRYRQINKKLCEIELIRGLTFKEIKFDKYQFYAYIHFINKSEFNQLFSKFINDEMLKNKLIIDLKLQNWLYKLLNSNYELFKSTKRPLNFNKNDELSNIIFLFSIIKIEENINDKLVKKFIAMIEEYNGNLDLYKSIGEFFKVQYLLNKTTINKYNINQFYTMIIEKLLKYFNWEEVNAWFYHAFEDGYFDISYMIDEEIFQNKEIVEKFISKVSDLEFNNQLKITLSFLLGLYKISEKETKTLLKEYFIQLFKNANRVDIKLHLFLLYTLNKFLDLNISELKDLLKVYFDYLVKNNEFFYLEAIRHNLKTLIKIFKIQDKDILEMSQKLENINLQNALKGHFYI